MLIACYSGGVEHNRGSPAKPFSSEAVAFQIKGVAIVAATVTWNCAAILSSVCHKACTRGGKLKTLIIHLKCGYCIERGRPVLGIISIAQPENSIITNVVSFKWVFAESKRSRRPWGARVQHLLRETLQNSAVQRSNQKVCCFCRKCPFGSKGWNKWFLAEDVPSSDLLEVSSFFLSKQVCLARFIFDFSSPFKEKLD